MTELDRLSQELRAVDMAIAEIGPPTAPYTTQQGKSYLVHTDAQWEKLAPLEERRRELRSEIFNECVTLIGWSYRHVARELQCDNVLCSRWKDGKADVPPQIIHDWLEPLARCHETTTPPLAWRTWEWAD